MKTQDEIVERIRDLKEDFGCWNLEVLIDFIDFEHAKEFLVDDAKGENWKWKPEYLDNDYILEQMREYMTFAWEKANNCRGISANRSVEKMIQFIWLIGGLAYADEIKEDYELRYDYYGKGILRKICLRYGFKVDDNGKWVNEETDTPIDPLPVENYEKQKHNYEVLVVEWFSSLDGCLGIVVIKNPEGEKKAYLGTGLGKNADDDAHRIVRDGAKVLVESLESVLGHLRKENGQ